MPVVEFKRDSLNKLVGEDLTEEDLRDKVPMMGCDLEHLDEETVKYEVFPDRPDMLSEEGFARSIKYFLGISEGMPEFELEESEIHLEREKVKARPHVTAAVVKNIELNEEILRSLMQVQEKIHKTFGRERRKIAIGIHDLDKVEPPFKYKAVNPEKFKFIPLGWTEELTLKEIQEKHEKGAYADMLEEYRKWPVIVDSIGEVLSFPPVINGVRTEVTEKTTNLFIDVTGTDEEAIEKALNILVTSLSERECDLETVEIQGIGERPDLKPEEIEVDLGYVKDLTGLDIGKQEIIELLEKMGFGCKGKIGMGSGEKTIIQVPPYRADVMHPIDIVEEIAIKHGYEEFEREIPNVSTVADPDKATEIEEAIKEILVGFGYQEVKNMVLTSKKNQFEKMNREESEVVELSNSLDTDHTICRKRLLPQLLKNFSENQHMAYPQKLFEVSECLRLNKDNYNGVEMNTRLTAAKSSTKVNYNEATSLLKGFMNQIAKDYKLKKSKDPAFMEGRRARVIVNKEEVGVLGEVNPAVLNNWGIEKPVVALEIDLDKFGG